MVSSSIAIFISLLALANIAVIFLWRAFFQNKVSKKLNSNQNLEISNLKAKVSKLEETLQSREETSAIAARAQMMAHDLRKPFSLLKLGTEALSEETDPSRIREIARQLVPSVSKAISQADHMIHDVMDLGHKADLHLEAISPDSLVELTISSVFNAQKNVNVSFSYSFNHHHAAMIDSLKIHRIMTNIVENALEATNLNCDMWFYTKEKPHSIDEDKSNSETKNFIEFTIGNSGSYIEESDRDQIFNSFFTKNKKSGTGLGLAVAKKIVQAHGGELKVMSDRTKGTEFLFSVPASDIQASETIKSLPEHSGDVSFTNEAIRRLAPNAPTTKVDLEEQLAELTNSLEGTIRVLLVDDHSIYLTGLNAKLLQIRGLKAEIECYMATTAADAQRIATKEKPHLIICDVDLGKSSPNGYELIREIRSSGSDAIICMHSNHDPHNFPDSETSLADGFLSKPMSQESLHQLLISSLTSGIPKAKRLRKKTVTKLKKRTIAFIDDCPFTRDQWLHSYTEAEVLDFESPEDFLKTVEENPNILEELSGVITDYFFSDSSMNGSELAKQIKLKRNLPVLLATDLRLDPIRPQAGDSFESVDRVIQKSPPAWGDLTRDWPLSEG